MANSHSHIYLEILFNHSLDTKFGPVKVRELKTPQHVTVHLLQLPVTRVSRGLFQNKPSNKGPK